MINLLFAGDFIPPANAKKIYSSELLNFLKDKDFSIVNLEAPLTDSKDAIEKNGNNFKISPDAVRFIKDGFFDAVTLSNNHIRDYGDTGVIDTLRTCNENNIKTVGAGKNLAEAAKPLKILIKGKKIVILNYSEREYNLATDKIAGANPFDIIDSFNDIQREKNENDYVIVVYHGGLENNYYPTPEIVKNFRFMVDSGADAVISHHTHRYSGAMYYKNKPLLFGIGNFITPTKSKILNDWLTGLITKIKILNDSLYYELVPVKMSSSFDRISLLQNEEKNDVIEKINQINSIVNDYPKLLQYWKNEDTKAEKKIYWLLKSDSLLEYRFRKYCSLLLKNHLSAFKKNNILNLIRCDSHRNRMIRVLQND